METLPPIDSESEYKHFPEQSDRDELFMFTEKVCQYLKEQDIHNLVLVDRAIRPIYIGISEYWEAKYPGEERPNIYFINPLGLKSQENTSPEDLSKIKDDAMYSGDDVWDEDEPRSQEEVDKDFRETFKNLVGKKDKVLVLDACIHTGNYITLVKEALEKAMGMKEDDDKYISLGVISLDDNSKVIPDFHLQKHRNNCFPFGDERLLAKTLKSVCSVRNESYIDKKEGRERRKEIRRIMKEQLNR